MYDIEPENDNANPYIRRSTKKTHGLFDEVHAEPFEIIGNNYFKRLIKGAPTPVPQSAPMDLKPKNLQFEMEKSKNQIKTSLMESDFYDAKKESEFNTGKNSTVESYCAVSDLKTFNSLVSLKNLSNKSMVP